MAERILDFLIRSRNLDSIERCSNTPHISRYPVSTHAFYTAIYSMVFADIENTINVDKYNTSEVIKKALLHDMEETITGDILYPVKHCGPQELKNMFKQIAETCIETDVFNGLPQEVRDYYIHLWKSSKDKSKEGRLVSAVDKFEILIYAIIENNLGNKNFDNMAKTAADIILKDFGEIDSLCSEVEYIMKNILNRKEVNLEPINVRIETQKTPFPKAIKGGSLKDVLNNLSKDFPNLKPINPKKKLEDL